MLYAGCHTQHPPFGAARLFSLLMRGSLCFYLSFVLVNRGDASVWVFSLPSLLSIILGVGGVFLELARRLKKEENGRSSLDSNHDFFVKSFRVVCCRWKMTLLLSVLLVEKKHPRAACRMSAYVPTLWVIFSSVFYFASFCTVHPFYCAPARLVSAVRVTLSLTCLGLYSFCGWWRLAPSLVAGVRPKLVCFRGGGCFAQEESVPRAWSWRCGGGGSCHRFWR